MNEKGIAPHIPVIDKSKRAPAPSRARTFIFYNDGNVYICPPFKTLTTTGKITHDATLVYRQHV